MQKAFAAITSTTTTKVTAVVGVEKMRKAGVVSSSSINFYHRTRSAKKKNVYNPPLGSELNI